MLKAKSISAVSITLTDNIDAVFVKEGSDWNGLREYRCIAPGAFVGQKIITAPDLSTDDGLLTPFFDHLLGRVMQSVIVMASPALAAALKAVGEAAEAPE